MVTQFDMKNAEYKMTVHQGGFALLTEEECEAILETLRGVIPQHCTFSIEDGEDAIQFLRHIDAMTDFETWRRR